MDDLLILIWLGFFLVTGSVFYFFFSTLNKKGLYETIRKAIDKGSDLSPELITKLAAPANQKKSDLRRGILIGLLTLAYIMVIWMIYGVAKEMALALFPGSIALGYFILWKYTHNED